MNENKNLVASENSGKLINYNFIAIFIANMLMYLGKAVSNTVFNTYLQSLGGTAAAIGLLGSLFTVSALLMKLFAGPTIDAFSRKNILTISMICMAIGYSGYGFVSSTTGIVIFKLLEGCGQAFVNVTCIVVISATVPKDKVGRAVGIFAIAQTAANAFGPSLGLWISQATTFKTTFLSAGGILLLGAVLTMTVKLPMATSGKKFKFTIGSFWAKEALIPCVIMFLFIGANNSINSFLVVYTNTIGLDAVKVGLFFTVQNIAAWAMRPFFGTLADKIGSLKLICTSGVAMVAVFALIMQGTLPCILIAGFVGCFGFVALQPVLQSMAMKFVPAEKRGAASSMVYIFMDLATLIIPTFAGKVADSTGNYSIIWTTLMVLIVVAVVFALCCRTRIADFEKVKN